MLLPQASVFPDVFYTIFTQFSLKVSDNSLAINHCLICLFNNNSITVDMTIICEKSFHCAPQIFAGIIPPLKIF